jgi:transcription elongation factor Elf1
MTMCHQEQIPCPVCGEEQEVTVYGSVNVTVDPHLFELLMKNKINTFECQCCGTPVEVSSSFLYHDMDYKLMVWLLLSRDDVEGVLESARRTDEMLNGAFSAMDQAHRMVFSHWELVEKALLARHRIDDRLFELFKNDLKDEMPQLRRRAPLRFSGVMQQQDKGIASLIIAIQDASGDTVPIDMMYWEHFCARTVKERWQYIEPAAPPEKWVCVDEEWTNRIPLII